MESTINCVRNGKLNKINNKKIQIIMKQSIFFKHIVFAVLVAGGICNRVHAQYQSFFGDSITEYSLAGDYVLYDPLALDGAFMYYPTINKSDTIHLNDRVYYRTDYQLSLVHYCPNYTCYSYIREDTTTGQIFLAWKEGVPEICVCDMSLSVGDTFHLSSWYHTAIVADSIEYINGKKVIHFRRTGNLYYCDDYYPTLPIMFIEGVGPTYGPVGWDYWRAAEGCVLLCMKKDGELVFILDEDRLGCYQGTPDAVRENDSRGMHIYPNPARNRITVELDNAFVGNGQIIVRDAVGRVLVAEKTNVKTIKLNLNGLQSGIYIVTYEEDNQKITKKIIKK